MTSYDDVFTCFINNCGDRSQIPILQDEQYKMIKNAAMHYNNALEDANITCDDSTELLSDDLDNNKLLILAHCLKYVYLQNNLEDLESILTPFQKEIGFKNYKDQINSRERTLARTNQKITELITYSEDNSLM